ncbi:uncharacterized protein LOC108455408 [Gossypium arboreum]|uniref:uncharacterized protein LOC108455408 n=1 Tax=Gossypium arboreum TaxID=29729 RepID=UPI00081920A3|nr:uncharacterized protein LOC108455408 [Gossypium arboreum]
MTDIENGYFLVKFQNKLDCERALSDGPWTIFGQYLIVQPWSMAFDPSQAYPIVLMAWVRFLGLLGYLYKHKILADIGETVGKVVKRYGHVKRICTFKNAGPLLKRKLIRMKCHRKSKGPVVQQSFAVPGSSSQTPATTTMQNGSDVEMTLQIESGSSTCFSVLTSDEREREEVAVEVGILDSGKHSAVIQSRVVGLFDGIKDGGANADADSIASEGRKGKWAEEKGEREPKEEGFEGFRFNGEEGKGEDNGRD